MAEFVLKRYQRLVAVDAWEEQDFSQLNCLLPHPVYAWMFWVCVLNPDRTRLEELSPAMDEAYRLSTEKFSERIR
ncbi:DUF6194 family protein [Marinospirillum sp.]